jgi:hypothetical protein
MLKLIYILCEDSGCNSQRTEFTGIARANFLMLFRELVVALCDNQREHVNRLCRKNSEFIVITFSVHIINAEI